MLTRLSPLEQRVICYLKNKIKYFQKQEQLYKYCVRGITVKEATDVLGTTELRKIMSNLRDKGYEVITQWEFGQDRFGTETRYKRYFIGGKKFEKELATLLNQGV